MKGPIAYMAKNHVASNMLMIVLIVGGILTAGKLKQEVFPEISLDMVRVTMLYPGATPSEVEDSIIRPIELAVSGVENVKRVTATASESVGSVVIEVLEGEDADLVLADVKSEVDRIQTFPGEAERPIVSKLTTRQKVMSVVVYGDASERAILEQAERVKDDLLLLDDITQVELDTYRPYEISVEISEDNLRKYNLTLDMVAQKIRTSSLDLAGGTIRDSGGDVQIRTSEKRYSGTEFDSVVVFSNHDGRQIYLKDIGRVNDGFAEKDMMALFDGNRAVMVQVYRVGDQTPNSVSLAAKKYIEARNLELPESMGLAIWDDSSEIFQSRINLLFRNGALGLFLVLITLAIFLEIRLAIWVAMGIAISFLGSMVLLPLFDVSINMISLFAFLIILGVVVDDAIVVGENIFVHRRMGKSWYRAAVEGTQEVSMAVIFAGLTTIAAFSPLLLVGGFMGKFMGVIPIIVISVLVISLVEALVILPSHLNGKLVRSDAPFWHKIESRRTGIDHFIKNIVDTKYVGLLRWVQGNRHLTIAISVAILLSSFGLIAGGFIKFRFMSEIEADEVTVSLTMPPGTPFRETEKWIRFIEAEGRAAVVESDINNEDGVTNLEHLFSLVGAQMSERGGPAHGVGGDVNSANLGQIKLLLTDPDIRTIKTAELAKQWRERVGDIPGAEELSFKADLISGGADIEIQLTHSDYSMLLIATERLKEAMEGYAGAKEVADSHIEGKREIKLGLKPEAKNYGISERDLAMQVRAAFYGSEALRIQRGQNEVKVLVRYPLEDRRSLATVDRMRIRTPHGVEIPFNQAAYVEEGRGYNTIARAERRRVVTVTSKVDDRIANASEVLADIEANVLPQLVNDYPGLSYDLEGESKNQKEAMADLGQAFLFALLMIFGLLAIPFRSFLQPLIVMSAIPFGFVGALFGHLIMGYSFSIISMFGIIALTGVVVNSSLVMIDFINRSRRKGFNAEEAIVEAGRRRFRPIIMTSLTTFFGLTPIIFETSLQARFLIPMALSLGFGVLFATAITLVLVPALYLVFEDVRKRLGMQSHIEEWDSDEDKVEENQIA